MNGRRTGGIALVTYGVVTTLAFMNSAPGGAYSDSDVVAFISSGHSWAAFALAYLGIIGALAILVLGIHLRDEVGANGPNGSVGSGGSGGSDGSGRDLVGALAVTGAATSLTGWFVTGGIAVAMAEGGAPVRDAIAHPVVYTLGEIGNLLAVCSPALCVGVIAIVLAARAALPRWLRVFSVVAGVCGILAPFFFTYFLFVLWTVVAGVFLSRSERGTATTGPANQPANQPAIQPGQAPT